VLKLSEVIPWGRSFAEYRRMFTLSESDLSGRILGCGDGPASFNAEATEDQRSVISCDPIYAFTATEIERRVRECYDIVIDQVKQNRDAFVWNDYRDADDLGQQRLAAMQRFLRDYESGQRAGRYVTASLPNLPFHAGEFTLAVSSHLLFLYSEHFSTAAHIAAITELLRVADEIRIFPLVTLGGHWSPHVAPVRDHLERAGFTVHIAPSDYEFQRADERAGNLMMRVHRLP